MLIVDSAIQRIKIYAFAVAGMNRYQLAKAAKLSEGATRGIHHDDWNPTLETIRQLERVIPADWSFEKPPILFTSTTTKKEAKACTPKKK